MRDLVFGLRQFFRSPGFAIAAIVSLAFGMGANTAIFSLLDSLLFRPISVHAPEQLIRIGPEESNGSIGAIPGGMLDWLRKSPLLDGVCGALTPSSTIEINNEPLPVSAIAASGDCFQTLGVHPALGRSFTLADDLPNGPKVAMLSYNFWQNKFGGDPGVLGQTIRIEGAPFTIIGVTQSSFQGLFLGYPSLISFPLTQFADLTAGNGQLARAHYWAQTFARLKPGVTREQVRAALETGWRRNLEQSLPPSVKGSRRDNLLRLPLGVVPGAGGLDGMLRNRYRQSLVGLLAISGLVLLIACLNVANLLLARGIRRRSEIALRLALGAARMRIVRQLATESCLLLIAGVGLAIPVSYLFDHVLMAILSQSPSRFVLSVEPDIRIFEFTAAISLVALLLFGILPALQTTRRNVADDLKNSSRLVMGGRNRSRRLLVAAQIAVALVLLTCASLFIETLRQLLRQPLGFETSGVINVQLRSRPRSAAKASSGSAYYRDLVSQLEAAPDVQSVSISDFGPLFSIMSKTNVQQTGASQTTVATSIAKVSDRFFTTMQIPLLAGSRFESSDTAAGQKKAIISRSLAAHLFPQGGAVGKHILIQGTFNGADVEIAGIAANARLLKASSTDTDFVYLNGWQWPTLQPWDDIQIRYSGSAESIARQVRNILRTTDHDYALRLRTLSEERNLSLSREKLTAILSLAFGAVALLLVGVGLFGLLAFFVANRTSEIGIRMALGASCRSVTALVAREAFLLTAIGICVGLPLSYMSERALSGLLYGVGAFPTGSISLSIALLVLVTALAAYFPARRATAIDPLVALRHE
jgi:predicted permease